MAKNQELFFTQKGFVKQQETPSGITTSVVYTDAIDLNPDGVRLLKATVLSYTAIDPLDVEYISIAVFDGSDYHEISRLSQADLAGGERDLFFQDNFPLDKNGSKYLNLDYATGKIVIGVKNSSNNNQSVVNASFYYEEY